MNVLGQFLFFLLAIAGTTVAVDRNPDILVNKTAIQLNFFQQSINLKQNFEKAIYYKVYSVNTSTNARSIDNVAHSRLVPDKAQFEPQPNSGVLHKPSQLVTFYSNSTNASQTGFMVKVFSEETNSNDENLIGFALVQPFESYETIGYRNESLIDLNGNIIGDIKVKYVVIRPIKTFNPMADHYISTDGIPYCGHRGTGNGIRNDLPEKFIENTISAFNYVSSKGAQMIELDVQLSHEKVPIIYHDFSVKTSVIDRHNLHSNITVRVPIKDLSLYQMKKISTNFMPFLSKSIPNQFQSFETLQSVLEQTNSSCGINVEIKYPQLYDTMLYEDDVGVEMNEYVDRILEVLYKYGKDRKMLITSFDSNICIMAQLKQNKYHVGFLSSGDKLTPKTKLYDPRTHTVELNAAFAQSMNLKGLSLWATNILTDTLGKYQYIDYVKNRNLDLYLWGAELNSTRLLVDLHKNGVDISICNHIDMILPSTFKVDVEFKVFT